MAVPRDDQLLFVLDPLRYGSLASKRRYVRELVKPTFTRASVGTAVSKSGAIRTFGVDVPRLEWYDLDGDGVWETPGIPLEGARTNLCLQSEDLGTTWLLGVGITRTGGQTDPQGGTSAYVLTDPDGDGDYLHQTLTFTGDGVKAIAVFVRAGTAATSALAVYDTIAAVFRHRVQITWTAGVPSLSTTDGAGTLFPVQKLTGGWYRLLFSVNGVVAANTNRLLLNPATAGVTADSYWWGVQAEDASFPSSYIKTTSAAATRSADSLTFPSAFGLGDTTVLLRMARPAWAGLANPGYPGLLTVGESSDNTWEVYGDGANLWSEIRGALNRNASRPTPAGAEIVLAAQFKGFTANAQTALDAGAGYSAFSDTTSLSAFASQTVRLGKSVSSATELYGALLKAIIARGLFERADMMAV